MFAPDVISLRQFYATPRGEDARAMIACALRELWPAANGDVALGIGYAAPYLESYLTQASPAMICMPSQQGAAYWPPSAPNLVFLAHESLLPLPDNSINRILLMHSVEHSEQLSGMMDEAWRVLTPGGRLLAIVPNRLGFWARSSRSPFGYGRPFSLTQLRDLMTGHHFTLTRRTSALFMPPSRLLWRLAPRIEKLGKAFCPFFGGVLLVEGEKQVYAAVRQPVKARKSYTLPIPAAEPALRMDRR
ncbi:MAG: methyltransferase domain-containing protein [Pseudomonadota bacterium]|nr:methyltransferase domain-containing protein [Pseudomonadota bacterium]MDE3038555.1 methyltransferase domain-containing protein [Pseudomonadota bacterium]